jgi:hypothetical protein
MSRQEIVPRLQTTSEVALSGQAAVPPVCAVTSARSDSHHLAPYSGINHWSQCHVMRRVRSALLVTLLRQRHATALFIQHYSDRRRYGPGNNERSAHPLTTRQAILVTSMM